MDKKNEKPNTSKTIASDVLLGCVIYRIDGNR